MSHPLLDNFHKAKKEILDYVGFPDDTWFFREMRDYTNLWWKLVEDKLELIMWHYDPSIRDSSFNSSPSIDEVYGTMYRGKDLSMLLMISGCEKSKYYAVLDNSKEIKDDT
jgi:hypothetical protein